MAGDRTPGFPGDGGPASSAEFCFNNPDAVTADAARNLVIADAGNFRVRVIAASTGTFSGVAMTAGDIYRVAGDGRFGFAGDGGPPLSAELARPDWVTVDRSGNLIVDDDANGRIRMIGG